MRNSPFQLKYQSVTKAIEQNVDYQRHKSTINEFITKEASPRDFRCELRRVNGQLQRTRRFENSSKWAEEERTNLRMLNKFMDIQRGQQLSVPRATYKTHERKSPVQKNHSLNYDKKKL